MPLFDITLSHQARFPSKRNCLRWQAANHGCQCKRLRLARFPSKRNASDCVWMETALQAVIIIVTIVIIIIIINNFMEMLTDRN